MSVSMMSFPEGLLGSSISSSSSSSRPLVAGVVSAARELSLCPARLRLSCSEPLDIRDRSSSVFTLGFCFVFSFVTEFRFLCSAASALLMLSCFFHLVRLFWNQIFTCNSQEKFSHQNSSTHLFNRFYSNQSE
jgi:hypothetical protein